MVVIGDVLSFTTGVEIAASCGGMVLPYQGEAARLPEFTRADDALSGRYPINPIKKLRILP